MISRKIPKLLGATYLCVVVVGVVPVKGATADYFGKCKHEVDAFIVRINTSTKPSAPGFAALDLAQYLETNAICGQSPEITDQITELLSSKDDSVRFGAALALANLGPSAKRAVPALKKALAESDADLDDYFRKSGDYMLPTQDSGVAIRAALKRITGKDFPSYVQSREAEERRSNPVRQ